MGGGVWRLPASPPRLERSSRRWRCRRPPEAPVPETQRLVWELGTARCRRSSLVCKARRWTLPATTEGYEFDLTWLIAKDGVRAFWKRGSFVEP
jgi:hypothetical protein